jgi:hypothetical protein
MPAPAIHWWHMPQNLSQREGMSRAQAVLATTAKGKISGDQDTLHWPRPNSGPSSTASGKATTTSSRS